MKHPASEKGHEMPSNVCGACQGDGKCLGCNGTGTNTHLNEDEPKCRNCSGSGVCSTCQGTGLAFVRPPEILDPGFNSL
jgi:hypothetical protein